MRNRTFWFGDYEGLRDQEGIPRVRLVPTAAEKAGLFSTAVVDPFAAGRPAFSQNAQGQWVIPRERWDPVGAAIVALIPDANASAGGPADLRVDARHRYAAGPVRRPHRSPVHAQPHVLRPLQLRGHADVPPRAAAGPGGGLVQRRVRIERQSIAGARARRDLDDLARPSSATSGSGRRAATITRIRRTSASMARRRSG